MAKVFVVSLAEAPLNEGSITGRVRSIESGTETVVHDRDELLAALFDRSDPPEHVDLRDQPS